MRWNWSLGELIDGDHSTISTLGYPPAIATALSTVGLGRSVHTGSGPWGSFVAGGANHISSPERRRVQTSAQQLDLAWPKPNSSTHEAPEALST